MEVLGMDVSVDGLERMAERAGLGMTREEVAALKPIYDLYAAYAAQLREIEFGAEEPVTGFAPDWPEA